ncbi:MAG: hypothetical protein JSV80_00630 [Acidobacteriota bacterium]|nr:MAG: hypothetical protein JSV80_00630 [Acidobacteriota bacterium]
MGVFYEAERQHPRRRVALEVIRGGQRVDDRQTSMFRREVQTLVRLDHPGLAAIYESGRTENGRPFFAMELVRGEVIASSRALPIRDSSFFLAAAQSRRRWVHEC